MNLASLKTRLNRLLETQGQPAGPPTCIVLLPANGRGSDADNDLPLPRLAWRNSKAACILYDAELGKPDADEIARLIEAAQ